MFLHLVKPRKRFHGPGLDYFYDVLFVLKEKIFDNVCGLRQIKSIIICSNNKSNTVFGFLSPNRFDIQHVMLLFIKIIGHWFS